jgi:hypothetical protein
MSYHEASIGKLSPAQISKLLNGHAARIKGGSVHKVKLSQEQAKKLHKAQMCGKAVQVRFDPYQVQMHQGLRKTKGGSFFGDTKHWYENTIPAKYRAPLESLVMAGAQDLGSDDLKGGSFFGDTRHWYENTIPAKYRAPIESLVVAGAQDYLGAGVRRRGRPRKQNGGSFLGDTRHWYENTIPAKYRAPIESLAMAGVQDLGGADIGMGLRRRKQKGGSVFGMLSKGAKLAVERAGPVVIKQLKPIVKNVAKKVVDYGVTAAGPAAAAAVTAIGQPELAPFALMAANTLAKKSEGYAKKYIEGLGVKGRKGRKPIRGSALYAAGY